MLSPVYRSVALCLLIALALAPSVSSLSLLERLQSALRHSAAVAPPAKLDVTYSRVTDRIDDNAIGDGYMYNLLTLEQPLTVTLSGNPYPLPGGTLMLLGAGSPGTRGSVNWASLPTSGQLGQDWFRIDADNAAISGQAELTSCSLASPLLSYIYISGETGDDLLTLSQNLSHWQAVDGVTPNISQYTQSSCEVGSDGCMHFFFGAAVNSHYHYPRDYNNGSWTGCPTDEGGISWHYNGNNTLAPRYRVQTATHRLNPHLGNGTDVYYAVDGYHEVYNSTCNCTGVVMTYHVSASLDGAHWHTLLADVPWEGSWGEAELLAITSNGVIVQTDTAAGVWASLDGGLSFGQCSGPPAFNTRNGAATTFDLLGRQFVMGGVNTGVDVWVSDVVWTDVKTVAQYCNVTAPADGQPGLREWPPARHVSLQEQ